MLLQAQCFENSLFTSSYRNEESRSMKDVRLIPKYETLENINVIHFRTIYKITFNYYHILQLESLPAPHHTEKDMSIYLKNNFFICAPTRVQNLLSTSTLNKGKISKI